MLLALVFEVEVLAFAVEVLAYEVLVGVAYASPYPDSLSPSSQQAQQASPSVSAPNTTDHSTLAPDTPAAYPSYSNPCPGSAQTYSTNTASLQPALQVGSY